MTTQERTIELNRLEELFKSIALPSAPISIGGFMKLNNIQTFIDTNINRANSDIASMASEPCIYRLQQLEAFTKDRQEG